jgi:hypothetical protein
MLVKVDPIVKFVLGHGNEWSSRIN